MTVRRHDALLAEDVIIPIHHHDERRDHFLASTPQGFRPVSPAEADVIGSECSLIKDVQDAPIADDGPKNVGGLRRRQVIGGAGAGLGMLLAQSAMPRMAFAAEADAASGAGGAAGADHTLVCIFLRGGIDGLSTVVPVDDKNYYSARPKTAIPADKTWELGSSGYGMNATFAALKPMWEAKDLALVLGAGSPAVTRSHFDDMDRMELAQGSAPAQVRSGWIARHLASSSTPGGTFRAITIGSQVATALTTNAFETLAMTEIKAFDILGWQAQRPQLLATLDALYGAAGGPVAAAAEATMSAVTGLADLRSGEYTPANGAAYPQTPFGRGLRDIARIIKAGKGLQAACVDLGGWDHHASMSPAFTGLSTQLSEGLAAFRADLGEAWGRTSVVAMSEFGRRVKENGTAGTDHGHGNVMLFAGGGVKGGVYGDQPELSEDNLELGEDVPIKHDYRAGLSDLITERLGNGGNLGTIFPGYEQSKPLGLY